MRQVRISGDTSYERNLRMFGSLKGGDKCEGHPPDDATFTVRTIAVLFKHRVQGEMRSTLRGSPLFVLMCDYDESSAPPVCVDLHPPLPPVALNISWEVMQRRTVE